MRWIAGFCLAFTLCAPAMADEDTIVLSTLSSDSTSASVLSGSLNFAVSGSTLSLTVTNASAFNIMDVYFNVDSFRISNLTLTGSTDWSLLPPDKKNSTKANGFGTFSYRLAGNSNKIFVSNGTPAKFTFDIAGSGSFSAHDFTRVASTKAPHAAVAAAAKFQMGPGDDSAFGATQVQVVPEPATFVYFGLAMIFVDLRWRRRSTGT